MSTQAYKEHENSKHLQWNAGANRYEAEVNGKRLCVDQEEFLKEFDKATIDPRNDEYKVLGHFTLIRTWEGRVGTTPHVYFEDFPTWWKHHISFASRQAYALFINTTVKNKEKWDGVDFLAFSPVNTYKKLYYLLELKSQRELPKDLEIEVYNLQGVMATTFNIPRPMWQCKNISDVEII